MKTHDRRAFLSLAGVGAIGVAVFGLRGGGDAEAAEKYPVEMSDAAWRKKLGPAAFNILRQGGTEAPYSSQLNDEHRAGIFACKGCDQSPLSVEDQVRQRHRLAELLGAAAACRSRRRATVRCLWREPRFIARGAAGISAMSLTMGRSRPASAIAWTAWRWCSIRARVREALLFCVVTESYRSS